MYIDEEGNLKSSNVTIVCGAAASGKTTYVKKHKGNGDMVVDLDLISQAISMCEKTSLPKNLLHTALAIRDFIYCEIANERVEAKNIWVVASLPNGKKRRQLANKLNAKIVKINATKEECIKNAINDPERKDKELQMQIIQKYFDEYSD